MTDRLSTQPYKGTRDFYPSEMQVRRWFFEQMRQVVGQYGYQEYDGPMLEPFEIYAAKTGEEIVNEQLYSFEDRGGRKVAMRPEMTPTLARMVAAKGQSLQKPLRWFSIPNLWRYERPQRGRLREHWQLNVDLLGVDGVEAEIEIIQVAIDMMRGFGASPADFEIMINHRQLMNDLFESVLKLEPAQIKAVARAIDKKEKISPEAFQTLLEEAGCSSEQISGLEHILTAPLLEIGKLCEDSKGYQDLIRFFDTINALGLGPVCRFNTSVMRGLDYYTGMVFELFDKHPENRRAIFGGGRYDNLVGMFGGTQIPGVGFGMGDVTLVDFLQTHGLLPETEAHVDVLVGLFNAEMLVQSQQLARMLRAQGIKVETVLKPQKLGKQFELADKKGIPLVLLQGPDEAVLEVVTVKNLRTGQQEQVQMESLAVWLQDHLGKR
ncbi:histidine--tRNA ligase [bacterium (Candidatus Blackallbacteria) CG17_big_fil_post_rev_8_21_14_2_50_48_46]|uniref:Histidine--tRNA ligase n=1 Tax=bacterium (Candidatus Blackallbacteria) CG17_big_fil_post_rev_8_21_14_2_50_48_46 TaxID=2014261 RepID=A0A2M7G6G4_9BACT|nr:MAG: histidine--tRNA ligase [bacterium (Candidatus Blackallbacteria) CG18_big_fil_WC_8_21_14_2_50_49_26]PIW17493.1 MAG: histidine--tRNA ligase [bacterium (Candidatus Blackallbacteria) CG17_big_fil_post_rev_8_21_14_2_50_48_46]PIW48347.1 MAG: histidine--tRNA ligase [bacterium (Candidatus Blackallbacteria) CG13_big_fil_rev_8_21_14_2_50_49_14]